ncbi:MAG: hypothetical protein ACF8CQ_11850 [Rhodopirellula sp. JB044]|uniref:hypothetical protein n=1 Tax=Rhodopirellula sp. JB044 TaxID=3342844 RepID=UPI00370B1452
MPHYPSAVHSLRRVFMQAFLVHDVTEPLVSFDDFAPTDKVAELMDAGNYEVVGIRRAGRIEGYLDLADIEDGACGDCMKPFEPSQVILNTEPLPELVRRLRDQRRLFVSTFGRIGGIVSRSDLDKPPVRMWLFGMITLIEMRFTRLIDRYCSEDEWKTCLSAKRVEKADQLVRERDRRNQSVALLDCLQLSDKLQIVARNDVLKELTQFQSRRQVEQMAKKLEKLRNNLAHCQTIVTDDWETILALSENLDNVLERTHADEAD